MKNRRIRLFTLVSFIIMVLLSQFPLFGADDKTNLLQNSGFENVPLSSWSEEMWNPDGMYELTTEKVHSGQFALKISTGEQENDIRLIQDVQVMPNTYYRFSGWIATENIPEGTMGATICLMGNGDYFAGDIRGTKDYTYHELNIKTSKSHYSIALAVRLGFFFNVVRGVAYFDDMKFEKLDKKPKNFKALPEPEESSIPGGKQKEEEKKEEKKKDPILGEMNFLLIIILVAIGLAVMAINIMFTIFREKKDVHEQEPIEEKNPPA